MSEEKSKKELELEKTREEARMLVEAKEKVEGDLLELKKQAESLNEEKDQLQSSTAQLQSDVEVCVHVLYVYLVYTCVYVHVYVCCTYEYATLHSVIILVHLIGLGRPAETTGRRETEVFAAVSTCVHTEPLCTYVHSSCVVFIQK